jgi:hypothetical protein
VDTVEELEALLEEPGERLPLVTAGEARAILGLLAFIDEETHPQAYELAQELRVMVGQRLPT